MQTADLFRVAAEKQDREALAFLLAGDVRLFSPVKFSPFEGIKTALPVLCTFLRIMDGFRYTGRLDGTAQTSRSETEVTSSVLPFRATVSGLDVHGMYLLHLDHNERIRELTVIARPQSAVRAVSDAMVRELTAAGMWPPRPTAT